MPQTRRFQCTRLGALRPLVFGATVLLAGVSFTMLPAPAFAQQEGDPAQPMGLCMPSGEAHECADRCPSFDTCFASEDRSALYYAVDDQRFDCRGLDCGAASQLLGDYCCRRGEFAPPGADAGGEGSGDGGGGGCALGLPPGPRGLTHEEGRWIIGAALVLLTARGRARARGGLVTRPSLKP